MRCDMRAIARIEAPYIYDEQGPSVTSIVDIYLAHLAEHGDNEGRKWKLVPVEPTPAMADTFWSVIEPAQVNRFSSLYRAALAAAPSINGDKG